MGHSLSKYRIHHHQNPSLPPPNHLTPSSYSTPPPPPPPPTTTTNNNNSNSTNNTSTISSTPQDDPIPSSSSQSSPSNSQPPPPLQSSYAFAANAPYPSLSPSPIPSSSYNTHISNCLNYPPPIAGYSNYHTYYANQSNGWAPFRPPMVVPPMPVPRAIAPPPYVDHKSAKKIKNDVNVHKDTIKVVLDENNLGSYLVSFTFDALVDGSITIFYFAKEGANCTFTPLYPEIYMPRRIPFHRGLGQKFSQPSGTSIDLGFFELNDLSNPSPKEDIFPLVIYADTCLTSLGTEVDQPLPLMSPHAQITQAVLEKNDEGHFQVRVIKQILWIDEVRYELREIYGINNSSEVGFDDSEPGKECVICMTEPKDTAVLPCRHMCMCSGCAKELRFQSNNCPICRQPIQELIEIKVKEESS